MAYHDHDPAAVEARLWKAIEDGRTGMLGLMRDDQHFQPMTAFVERDSGQIWFFTYKDTDLAQAVAAQGGHAMFVFQGKDLQACIGGHLSVRPDRERMERYWNPVVAAWYPEGKDDERLTLLCLDCTDAQVWVTEAGLVKFAYEIAKANASKTRPDLGERANLSFH
ncbi:pyridoxamine 5'-phosphate oxidase family protein [Phenylobacterium sp.]|jgi:general stress protein 26|uniref:pyridoxamine 5'-phosphate oxidase family protein n=1 Tax=Phenylobacterium sp. TaxID=1871053 RepID=UPI002F94D501